MNELVARLRDNLAGIQTRMERAALRANRNPADVRLVAVTKYVDIRLTRALVEAGCHQLAENRPQALWEKAVAVQGPSIEWHLIGHLQRNKVRRTLPLVRLVHSVDSVRLLSEIDAGAAALGQSSAVLLEVNISGDPAKLGFHPDELSPIMNRLEEFPHLAVRGLMAMASIDRPGEAARVDFRALRQLRDELRDRLGSAGDLIELSMGMSDDFEPAIEEGATLVRIGSAIFSGIVDE